MWLCLTVSYVAAYLIAIVFNRITVFVLTHSATLPTDAMLDAVVRSLFVIAYPIGSGLGLLGMVGAPRHYMRRFLQCAATSCAAAVVVGLFGPIPTSDAGEIGAFLAWAAFPAPIGISLAAALSNRD